MRNGVDEGIADLAAAHMLLTMRPALPDELPQTSGQLLWLLDQVACRLAILIETAPNEPDLQYTVNILAQLESGAPRVWKTYPPFMVAALVVAIVYRFRVGMYQGVSLARWSQAIHRRYEEAVRRNLSAPLSQLFDWVVVFAAKDLS